jgi:hypothetical protein
MGLHKYEISEEYRVFQEGTSDGTQDKYFYDGYWYKLDRYGGEGMAEFLAYRLMYRSNMNEGEYAEYEPCLINGRSGCRSPHFLKRGDNLVTIYRLHQRVEGTMINDVVRDMKPSERAEYTVSFVKKSTGLDLRKYLARTFFIDALILNEDRHFNNLSVIFSQKDGFREAPIFDNGKSLLVGNPSVRERDPIEINVKKVVAQPFSGSHKKNFELFREWCDLKIDVDGLVRDLEKAQECYAKQVLLWQLEHISEVL